MIIRIIPRVKGEDDYPDEVNVISTDKSEFCCDELKDMFEYGGPLDEMGNLSFGDDYVYLHDQYSRHCPYCGTKIYTELIETQYKKEYDELVRKQEEERLERIMNLPPRSKYWIKKTKREAKNEYERLTKKYIP